MSGYREANPGDVDDFPCNWDDVDAFPPDDTISTSSWATPRKETATPGVWSPVDPSEFELYDKPGDPPFGPRWTKTWKRLGTAGVRYACDNTITTSQGRTLIRTLFIRIRDDL